MPAFQNTRLVNHSAENMFRLVSDVESYPEFIPLCEGLVIRSKQQVDDNKIILDAEMRVAYGHFHENFSTKVMLDEQAKIIRVSYLDGPFSHLENEWSFEDIESEIMPRSKVHFFIDYEFKSRTLGFLMGSIFDKAFKKLAISFEKRADALYGVTASCS